MKRSVSLTGARTNPIVRRALRHLTFGLDTRCRRFSFARRTFLWLGPILRRFPRRRRAAAPSRRESRESTRILMAAELAPAQSAQLEECERAFDAFAKGGVLDPAELAKVMRAGGLIVTNAEAERFAAAMVEAGSGVERLSFMALCKSRVVGGEGPDREDVLAAFRLFDPDSSGWISAVLLREVMTTLGEGLSNDEVDEMIREIEVNAEGLVDYATYVSDKLFPRADAAA